MANAVGGGRDTNQASSDNSNFGPAKFRAWRWRSGREEEVEQALYQVVDKYEWPVEKLLGV